MLTLISSILTSLGTSLFINSNKALFTPGQGGIADYINAQFYLNVGRNKIEEAKDVKAMYENARQNKIIDTQAIDELKNQLLDNAKNLDLFKQEFNEKIKSISTENLMKPRKDIIAPIFNDFPIYGSDDEIRNMYVNLLSSSMDKTKYSKTRPSFVQIIKELSPIDARILNKLDGGGPAAKIVWNFKNNSIIVRFEHVFIDKNSEYSTSDIAESIDNLLRLNIIKFDEGTIPSFNYDLFKETPEFSEAKSELAELSNNPEYSSGNISVKPELYRLTNFGIVFKHICLGN